MRKVNGSLPNIQIDPEKMEHIEKGADYPVWCKYLIPILIILSLLYVVKIKYQLYH